MRAAARAGRGGGRTVESADWPAWRAFDRSCDMRVRESAVVVM